jgi:hypothetical protein
MTDLIIRKAEWASLRAHLVPRRHVLEEAAFLFAQDPGSGLQLVCREIWLLKSEDFAYQSASHIELSDSIRARIIKNAHETRTAIVELHSHTGRCPAQFSYSDHLGFTDWVPHMRWRLKGRPYGALVITRSGIDGFIWQARTPERIGHIRVIGGKSLHPTGLSSFPPPEDENAG